MVAAKMSPIYYVKTQAFKQKGTVQTAQQLPGEDGCFGCGLYRAAHQAR